jgi:hypothetical protein
VQYYDAGAAFERGDYDQFVSIQEQILRQNPTSSEAMASLASALACKYAKSGDAGLRSRAEDLLTRAGALAQNSAEERRLTRNMPIVSDTG